MRLGGFSTMMRHGCDHQKHRDLEIDDLEVHLLRNSACSAGQGLLLFLLLFGFRWKKFSPECVMLTDCKKRVGPGRTTQSISREWQGGSASFLVLRSPLSNGAEALADGRLRGKAEALIGSVPSFKFAWI